MNSGYEISWSKEARQNLIEIINYLQENWNRRQIIRFISKFEMKIQVIGSFPYSNPQTQNRKELRSCVLSKQTTIYYKIFDNCIEIVWLKDNRKKQVFDFFKTN